MIRHWKRGRGQMGPMAPLLGRWSADADSPMGPVTCIRDYQKFGDHYVRLDAEWRVRGKGEAGKTYREVCMFGPDLSLDGEKRLAFWSYSNDGKKSSGHLADGTDIHLQAICFDSQMDAGLARQVFWPDAENGFYWRVESATRKGWNRMVEHHYRPA